MKNSYVYLLLDSRKPGPYTYGHWKFSHEPFYVGMGKREHRLKDHDEHCKNNPFKASLIRKIKRAGFSDCLRVVKRENLTWKEASSLEVVLISKIGRRDLKLGPLTNLTNGGDGGISELSPRKEKERRRKQRDTLSKRTPQQLAERNAKFSQTYNRKSDEEKLQIGNKKRTTLSNKSEKDKEDFKKKMSAVAKQVPVEKRATGLKAFFAEMTPKERKRFYKKRAQTRNSITPERQAEITAKRLETKRRNAQT
jgi:hypothetical protein